MDKYSRTVFLALVFSLLVSLWHPASAQSQAPEARKFDEFGDLNLSDIAARLDNFAIELRQNPKNRGFLIVYRSRRDLPGLSSRLVNWMEGYLMGSRGLSAETIVAVDGGVAGAIAQELWIVPPGAAPKPRADAYAPHFEDTDSARKFDEGHYSTPNDFETNAWEEHISLEAFAEALRKEPEAFGYLIGYAGYRIEELVIQDEKGRKKTYRRVLLDPPGTAAKELKRTKEVLDRYLRPGLRIKLINGGYRKSRSVEYWIVPRGEHAPIPTPNAFPKKRR